VLHLERTNGTGGRPAVAQACVHLGTKAARAGCHRCAARSCHDTSPPWLASFLRLLVRRRSRYLLPLGLVQATRRNDSRLLTPKRDPGTITPERRAESTVAPLLPNISEYDFGRRDGRSSEYVSAGVAFPAFLPTARLLAFPNTTAVKRHHPFQRHLTSTHPSST